MTYIQLRVESGSPVSAAGEEEVSMEGGAGDIIDRTVVGLEHKLNRRHQLTLTCRWAMENLKCVVTFSDNDLLGVVSVKEAAACIEHLKIPPFSDPTTNRLLSSFANDKQVPNTISIKFG